MDKIKKFKTFVLDRKNLKHTILIIIVTLTVIFSGFIYGPKSIFYKPLPFTNAVIEYIYRNIPTALTSYFIICGGGYLNKLLFVLMHKVFNHTPRSETILKMLYSFIKYGIAIVMILFILTLWGVDSSTLLASAGGLALVVGLGAQSLISDILAGVFIVFEGEFNVGDIIVIDGWRGKVLSIGIRSTKFRDIYGDIKTINNSQITTVVNKTKELSMADVVVGINYGEDLERVEAIIKKEIDGMNDRVHEAQEDIKYLGVQDLNASSVDLLFITYCKEEHILAVKRKMRREIKLIFDHYKIEIPYQHITLENQRDKNKVVKEEVTEQYYQNRTNNDDDDIDYENLLFNKAVPEKETLLNKEALASLIERNKNNDDAVIVVAANTCFKQAGKHNYKVELNKNKKRKKRVRQLSKK